MVDRSERKWVWGFALLVIVLTTLPYLVGFFRQGSDWRYTGFLFGSDDGNSYIAKMLRGSGGDWLFRTPYTAYAQRGAFAYFPFTLLGKLSAPPGQHEQLVALYHLFRAAGILLYVFATYDFIALFVRERRWRRLGTALASLGGGLGFLIIACLGRLWGNGMPLEYYSPETFGFLMIFGLPHLACARAFLLWGLRDYLRPRGAQPGWKYGLRTFLTWLGVGLMQPLTIVCGWAVIGLHIAVTGGRQAWLARRNQAPGSWATWKAYFRRALWTGLLSAPLVVYTLLAFQMDPFLRAWQAQNQILSPEFTHYLLAYGLLLPLTVLGIRPVLREHPWDGWLVAAWVAAFPLLAYAPYGLQRRLPDGVWVAVVILFLKWVECSGSTVRRWAPRWAALSFITTLLVWMGALVAVWSPHTPLYIPAEEGKAFQYLSAHAAGDDVVLASASAANPLAAWADVRNVIGHGPESINGDALRKQVACFYSDPCVEIERTGLLRELGVRYVFWGPEERALGSWDPRSAPYLKPVYAEGQYMILEFNRE